MAALTVAAVEFEINGVALAVASEFRYHTAAVGTGNHTSFEALKQINAGVLNIGYAEAGRQMVSARLTKFYGLSSMILLVP